MCNFGKIANLDSTKGCMEMMSRHQCGGIWIRCIICLPLLVVKPVTKDLPPQYPTKTHRKKKLRCAERGCKKMYTEQKSLEFHLKHMISPPLL